MTTPRDGTNTTERAPRSSESPPDEPRRASGPEGQSGGMPPGWASGPRREMFDSACPEG